MNTRPNSKRKAPLAARLSIAAVIVLALLAPAAVWLLAALPRAGLEPPVMANAHLATTDVIGDLGGMPVEIPSHMAELVEYDGDPGWSGPRKGPAPVRTQQSKLMSFGFYVRFPDMVGPENPRLRDEQMNSSIYETMWLNVGVTTGDHYPGDGFLARRFESNLREIGSYWWTNYERQSQLEHGLTRYVVAGLNPKDGSPARLSDIAPDLFIATNTKGAVSTYIDCSNRQHAAAPCSHDFSLEHLGIRAQVDVGYRRGLLPHWKEIESAVTKVILGFKKAGLSTASVSESGRQSTLPKN